MRTTVLALLTAFVLMPEAASAQTQFEGRVRATITAAGTNIDVEQLVKGSGMRMDMALPDGQAVSQIMDLQAGRWLMLLHNERMWADMSVMGQLIPGFSGPSVTGTVVDLPEFERTDRVETIAGYECRHYILLLEGAADVDVCSASGLGSFIPGAPLSMGGGAEGMIPALPQSAELWMGEFAEGFFVLSLEASDASYRATEVSPGPVQDDVFAPPSDYTPMQIPGF